MKEDWKSHIVLMIFVLALYSNTLNHYFVLDDGMTLTQNKFTQQGIKGIPDLLKYNSFVGWLININGVENFNYSIENSNIVVGSRYRPLSLVTFALEVEFFGNEHRYKDVKETFRGNAFVSHLVNVLLYLFTICLLFQILNRLLPPEKDQKWYLSFPFIATLLFLSHPIHTEVVANIKGRDEIMALLGSLGALWFTIKYIDTKKTHHLVWSGLCLFLGLLSKENTITFLAVIPVTIFYFRAINIRKIWVSMIPLMIVSVLFLIIRALIIGFDNTSSIASELLNNPFVDATKSETLATAFYTLFMYLKLLFFPHPLTYDYYPYHIEIVNWSNPVALVSLLLYTGIGIYAVYGLINKKDVCSYAIWFYLLPLSVVSNIFFPIGAFMGERFIFFSSIGFAVFIGWLIYSYIPRLAGNAKSATCLMGAIMICILSLYSIKTINRNRAWKDNFTLFTTDISTSKNSAKGNYLTGCEYLMKALYVKNDDEARKSNENCEKASKYLEHALQLYPQFSDAAFQLANLNFFCKSDIAKSLHYYAIALQDRISRNSVIAESCKKVLSLTPEFLENNGEMFSTPENILTSCDELLTVWPDLGEVYYVRGLTYGKYLHNIELALINFEQALSMDFPKTAKFYEYMGAAYGMSGNNSNAIQHLLKAIELGTDDHATYLNLGVIYQKLGDMENAKIYTTKGNEMKNNASKND